MISLLRATGEAVYNAGWWSLGFNYGSLFWCPASSFEICHQSFDGVSAFRQSDSPQLVPEKLSMKLWCKKWACADSLEKRALYYKIECPSLLRRATADSTRICLNFAASGSRCEYSSAIPNVEFKLSLWSDWVVGRLQTNMQRARPGPYTLLKFMKICEATIGLLNCRTEW